MLYEKTVPWASSSPSQSPRGGKAAAGPKYRLVGFVTLFRSSLPADLVLQDFREMSPRADQVWEQRNRMVRLNVSQFLVLPSFQGQGHGKQLMRAVYKEAQRDETVLDVRVEEPTDIFSALRQAVELDMLAQHDLLHPLRSSTPPWLYIQGKLKISGERLFLLADAVGCKAGIAGVKESDQGYPTVAGVPVDLESVYSRASVLGFSKEELDDILQAIQPEDLQGTASPQDAADRLLSSVYMAIVSDVGEAEGLSEEQVDELLARVEPADLLHISSGQEIARMILPLVGQIKAGCLH